ncbi:MAG: response regulator transcription factor [Clostridia bacterium]|nr:response regulator transcription factor [Clostridia bacterium]
MRIAICDKDSAFSIKLKQILYSYSNLHNLDFFIETFDSGEKLLNSKNRYTLIFIEYTLTGINGLETVKQMRRQNDNTKIIFLTTNTHFVFEAFEVNTYRFLTKPLSEKQIYKSLNQFFTNSNTHYPLWINNGESKICLNSEEILYIEANNKHCLIHLNDKTLICKKTMARVFEVLPKVHFQKINRAFIINLSRIESYNADGVFLKNGENLHITRTYYKCFKENYFKYTHPKIL